MVDMHDTFLISMVMIVNASVIVEIPRSISNSSARVKGGEYLADGP